MVQGDGQDIAEARAKDANAGWMAVEAENKAAAARIKAESDRELAEAFKRSDILMNLKHGQKNPLEPEPVQQGNFDDFLAWQKEKVIK